MWASFIVVPALWAAKWWVETHGNKLEVPAVQQTLELFSWPSMIAGQVVGTLYVLWRGRVHRAESYLHRAA